MSRLDRGHQSKLNGNGKWMAKFKIPRFSWKCKKVNVRSMKKGIKNYPIFIKIKNLFIKNTTVHFSAL